MAALDFNGAANDFFVNLSLQTTLALPSSREAILHFCEAVQKEFHEMTSFYQRETGEFALEGDHESDSYQWMEMQANRLSAGYFNPPDVAEAARMHRWLLERSVYYLGVSALDVECLDILFGFNLDFQGNRDAIVADALLSGSALSALAAGGAIRWVECEPSFVVALDEEGYLQARLSLETRSGNYRARPGRYEEETISVYFTVRRYPQPGKVLDLKAAYSEQLRCCEDFASRIVVPQVIQPIAAAIAAAQ